MKPAQTRLSLNPSCCLLASQRQNTGPQSLGLAAPRGKQIFPLIPFPPACS